MKTIHLKRPFLFFSLTLLLVTGTTASLQAKPYPFFYKGVRPLGMGNAFTAVADDQNALFYNPAGLADIDTFHIEIFNPMVEVSENGIDLLNDIQDADLDDVGETTNLLRQYVGENVHARAVPLLPNVGFSAGKAGVMIAGLSQANLDIDVRNPAWPTANVTAVADAGILGGVGMKLPFSGLRAGATLKYIYRQSLEESYTATDIADDNFEDRFEDDFKTGNGASIDLGLLYTLPIEAVTTNVGLTVQNLFEMGMGDAKDIDRQVNFGIALEKSFANFKLIGAADYVDITRSYEEDDDIAKRIHFGAELQFPMILAIRGGYNQGYLGGGATADFRFMRLDFATYTEEAGAYAGQRNDRRYVGQVTFGW